MRNRLNYGVTGSIINITNNGAQGGVYAMTDLVNNSLANTWPVTGVLTINGVATSLLNTPYTATANGFYTATPSASGTYRIQLWGGGGAGPSVGTGNAMPGGAGGYVEGTVSLQGGTPYCFVIGAGGYSGASAGTSAFAVQAYPDGGLATGTGSTYGSNGGGSSRFGKIVQSFGNLTSNVSTLNNTSASYLLIAGGGGSGTGNWNSGVLAGYGGGTNGAAGGAYFSSDTANSVGKGGTQSAGGAAGTGGRIGSPTAGAKYAGGNGYYTAGGGGYYGGGGAYGYYSQSGGGSGYFDSGNVTSGTFYTATTGNTTAYISPDPRTNKVGNVGNGGQYNISPGNRGYDGGIIITFVG